MLLKWQNREAYWHLMRADKPIGIYLLLWPTMWALLWAANGFPAFHILFIFTAGVVLMRSAGCVINDYADRKVDGEVARTKSRPLVSGRVSANEALQLFACLIALAFILVLFLNWQTIVLSVGALFLASLYPFMKRYTHLPQIFLGAAFSWAIPMAFMAIQESLPYWLWIVYLANLTWTVAYDTAYAMVDRDDDLKVGIKSTAILFGRYDVLAIGILQVISLGLLIWVGIITELNVAYFVSLFIAAGMFIYQLRLVTTRQKELCFKAFLHNHWVGLVITCGIFAGLSF